MNGIDVTGSGFGDEEVDVVTNNEEASKESPIIISADGKPAAEPAVIGSNGTPGETEAVEEEAIVTYPHGATCTFGLDENGNLPAEAEGIVSISSSGGSSTGGSSEVISEPTGDDQSSVEGSVTGGNTNIS